MAQRPAAGTRARRWHRWLRALAERIGAALARPRSAPTLAMVAASMVFAPALALAQVKDMPGGPKVLQLNLHDPASSIAQGQHWLHEMLLWVCLVIFIAVFGAMFYSIYAHRRSKGAKPADFHESTTVEIAWTSLRVEDPMDV